MFFLLCIVFFILYTLDAPLWLLIAAGVVAAVLIGISQGVDQSSKDQVK